MQPISPVLFDGEGSVSLSRRHSNERRQLVVSIANTEMVLLQFVRERVGAGKITLKRVAAPHHTVSGTYSISNRQALSILHQLYPYLRSHKRERARLVRDRYLLRHASQWQVHTGNRAHSSGVGVGVLRGEIQRQTECAGIGGRPSAGSRQRGIGGGGGTAVPPLSRRAGLCLHPEQSRERSVLSEVEMTRMPSALRILVPTPSCRIGRSMSLYRATEVGLPSPLGVAIHSREWCRVHRMSSVFTLPLRAKATWAVPWLVNRTRVRKHYATGPTCLAVSLYLAARYPTGREDARPASARFNEAAWSTPTRELVSASPESGCTSTYQAEVRRD
jgi:hypothetical protein